MPRKGPAVRRELRPDPVYHSVLVTQVFNRVLSRGKRTLAERIVYDALSDVADKSGNDPVSILKKAVENTEAQRARRIAAADARAYPDRPARRRVRRTPAPAPRRRAGCGRRPGR